MCVYSCVLPFGAPFPCRHFVALLTRSFHRTFLPRCVRTLAASIPVETRPISRLFGRTHVLRRSRTLGRGSYITSESRRIRVSTLQLVHSRACVTGATDKFVSNACGDTVDTHVYLQTLLANLSPYGDAAPPLG